MFINGMKLKDKLTVMQLILYSNINIVIYVYSVSTH